jgi:CBS domain containing-hemolysin-like protein
MIFDILLTIVLVCLNGFFVAAEFSIVKVRYSQIHLKAEKGSKTAKISENIINHLDTYLSATQLGITLASLGLGWIGEPVVAKLISRTFMALHINISDDLLHSISIPTGFLLITILHIVFGELAPKSLAIRKSESTTLAVTYPLYWFYIIFRPFIWLMNSISNSFLKMIGIQPVGKHEIHSTEELRLLVKQSKEGGEIQNENYEIIKNAFDFTDYTAKQIMIPRQEVFSLDIELSTNEMIKQILDNGFSRVPVFQDSMDNILGIAYVKDIYKEHFKNSEFKIFDLLHQIYYVYETKLISEILTEFQKKHIHMAVVIDEFGGTQGIITIEDILEELVGEIQDEDDDEKPIVDKKDEKTYVVQSIKSLIDINDHLPRPFEINDNYTTLTGLIFYHFGKIPNVNDKITINNFEITILKKQHRTIHSVELKDLIFNKQPDEDLSAK